MRWVLSFDEPVLGSGRRAGLAGQRKAGLKWTLQFRGQTVKLGSGQGRRRKRFSLA